MKNLFAISLLFSLLTACVTSYADDYLDSVSTKVCECTGKIPVSSDKNRVTMQFGVCILSSFSEQEKALFSRDYDVDFNRPDRDGKKIGSIVGARVIQHCPNTFTKVVTALNVPKTNTITGVITKVDSDFFVVFSLKDDIGNSVKLYWIQPVESNVDLPNTYASLAGKPVEVKYEIKDVFDPKVGDYRQLRVLTELHSASR
jgi:hypothetical protein